VRPIRLAVYGDVNLNLIDGSAIWLASLAYVLHRITRTRLRGHLEGITRAAANRMILLPPMVAAFARLGDRHSALELHIAGDKIHDPPDDRGFRPAVEAALRRTDRLVRRVPDVTLATRRPPRVLVVSSHDRTFFTAISDHLSRCGAQLAFDDWRGHACHDEATSTDLLERADVVICEWAVGNAVWFSHGLRPEQRLGGPPPWDLRWVWMRLAVREHFTDQLDRIRLSPVLRRAVSVDGHQHKVARWLRQVGFVLSPSDDESFHLAGAEGKAAQAYVRRHSPLEPVVDAWADLVVGARAGP
jgi:hypothetical protein